MNGYAWGILTLPIALAGIAVLAGLAWIAVFSVQKITDRAYRIITDDTTDAGRPVTKAMLRRTHWYRSASAADLVTAHRVWRFWFGRNARVYLVTGPNQDDSRRGPVNQFHAEIKWAINKIEDEQYHPEDKQEAK